MNYDQIKTNIHKCSTSLLNSTDYRAQLKKFLDSSVETSLPNLIDRIKTEIQSEKNDDDLARIRGDVRLIRATIENHNPYALWISSLFRSFLRLIRIESQPSVILSLDKSLPKLKELELLLDKKRPQLPPNEVDEFVKWQENLNSQENFIESFLSKLAPPSLTNKGIQLNPETRLTNLKTLMKVIHTQTKDDLLAKKIINFFEKPDSSLKGMKNHKEYALILLQAEIDTIDQHKSYYEKFPKLQTYRILKELIQELFPDDPIKMIFDPKDEWMSLAKIDEDTLDEGISTLAKKLLGNAQTWSKGHKFELNFCIDDLKKYREISFQGTPPTTPFNKNQLNTLLSKLNESEIVDFFMQQSHNETQTPTQIFEKFLDHFFMHVLYQIENQQNF